MAIIETLESGIVTVRLPDDPAAATDLWQRKQVHDTLTVMHPSPVIEEMPGCWRIWMAKSTYVNLASLSRETAELVVAELNAKAEARLKVALE